MGRILSMRRHQGEASDAEGAFTAVVDLLGELAQAGRGDFEALRARAATLQERLADERRALRERRSRPRDSRARQVDEWILDIFRSTESALPRETLLQDFLQRFRQEYRVLDNERHAGPWLFVLRRDAANHAGVEPVAALGVHPQAMARIFEQQQATLAEDPFVAPVLIDGGDIEGWHALWFGGSRLFDRLLDIPRRFGGEPDYWVNATALPGARGVPAQAVFVLHRNAGDLLEPEPPAAMRHDQRLLMALSLAWRQLEHQVASLARLTEQDRREMVTALAPGLLHHEVGTTLRSLYGQGFELFHVLKAQALASPAPWLDQAVRYSHGVALLALRGYRLTDVFNNLEKRGQLETRTLHQLMEDLRLLLHHRLGAAATELTWDAAEFAAESTTTDVVLLQQAVINLLVNALNAISEAGTPPPRRIQVASLSAPADRVAIAVTNNGPPVPASLAQEIFRRGFTTRTGGHGQGLYLVRLIAHYLGGEVTLQEPEVLPPGSGAGFRLEWRRHLTAEEGLARVHSDPP
jgi:signal transduction histidine kinase